MGKYPCTTFEDCVKWARLSFEENFVNKIVELTFNFPKDSVSKSGKPFWSPPKRFPTPVEFNSEDPMHMLYVMAGANLKASTFQIARPSQSRKPEFIKKILSGIDVPKFTPTKRKIKVTEEDEDEFFSVEDLQKQIPSEDKLKDISMTSESFEKDDDTNFHMDFITAAANLRARNYEIEEVDKLKAKLIAGRIIPAIATATALATGLAMLEMFKLVNNRPMGTFKDQGAFRCSSNNLAIATFNFFEPLTPIEIVDRIEKHVPDPTNHPEYEEEEEILAYPPKHTIWDKLYVKLGRDFTLQDLVDYFKKDHGLDIDGVSVSHGNKALLVYAAWKKDTHARLPTKFAQLVQERTGEDLSKKKYYLPCINFSKGGVSVDTATVVMVLE